MFVLRTVLGCAINNPHVRSGSCTAAYTSDHSSHTSSLGTSSSIKVHPNPYRTYHRSPVSDQQRDITTPISISKSTPTPIPTPIQLDRPTLHRLHHLSALNPPPPDSIEEKQLLSDLSDLISLMDQVKSVRLPTSHEERGRLLGQGVGQVKIDEGVFDRLNAISSPEKHGEAEVQGNELRDEDCNEEGQTEETSGKELLNWATTRVGDFYSSKLAQK
ncbi:hypothetical protein IAR55_003078 [Kwoniella newhampshirensis]|uniref:Glutamyl-tRNA(Gln) amidotransferase subunit F, mitochondrial n=1 Tax=Kwoniella newhampshirensis TaxID=1651941 RepID=A0AAW0Z0A9_9TREE